MAQMYHKVFIDNREIAITGAPLEDYFEIPTFLNIDKFYAYLEQNESELRHEKIAIVDVDGKFWNAFENAHKVIEAAGGVVVNEDGNLLVIERLGVWDLPKGKLEKNETAQEGAAREVEEECGISNLKIEYQLPDTFHTYVHKGKRVLKQSYWFWMRYSGTEKLIPQTEEGITQVLFMGQKEVEKSALQNTYASLEPLFQAYLLRNE